MGGQQDGMQKKKPGDAGQKQGMVFFLKVVMA